MIKDVSNEKQKKYNYVYKLTLKSNPNIYYIGKRSTDKEDDSNYLGSGKGLIKYKEKYGKNCFNKEILSYWKTAEEALIEERRLVTKELVEDANCLNRIIGGGSFDTLGCKWGPRTAEQNKRNSESHKGLTYSDACKQKKSNIMKIKWQDKKFREKMIDACKEKYNKEHLSKLSEMRKGKICLIKDGKWKYVAIDEIDNYINEGWKRRGVENKPSYEEIINYRDMGWSFKKIGEMYNVSESVIRQWKKKYEYNMK